MPEIKFESLLAGLPPEPTESILREIQGQITATGRKVVVLDDDPTGTQTVHGVSVLTEWTVPVLQAEFESDDPAFYILTNSRSLPADAARTLSLQIGANLKIAAQQAGREFVVISRSDSTLRGHFPAEVDTLADGLQIQFDGLILVPYFREGNRYTVNDTHYVVSGDKALPAAETEFARDPVFGYSESDLRLWVQQKTAGRIRSTQVASLSIQEIRTGNILSKLSNLHNGQVCIVNAVCDRDIELVVAALLEAEASGKHFLYRTAASFVRVRAGITQRPLLVLDELHADFDMGGLVVIGSFVPKTTSQLEHLRKTFSFVEIELNVDLVLDESKRAALLAEVQQKMNSAISTGRDVLLYTSRNLVKGNDERTSLQIGKLISESLVACVRGLQVRPRYLIAKGGITSSDIATQGLAVRKALVLGQALAGVPVWRLGAESRFPGMAYVVFPGNVGDENALSDVVARFRSSEEVLC
jgi:uncharacterized protein YgbK (DUF1537 family)